MFLLPYFQTTPASANQQGTTRSQSDSIMHNRVIRTRDCFWIISSSQYIAGSTYCHVESALIYSCQILFQGPVSKVNYEVSYPLLHGQDMFFLTSVLFHEISQICLVFQFIFNIFTKYVKSNRNVSMSVYSQVFTAFSENYRDPPRKLNWFLRGAKWYEKLVR